MLEVGVTPWIELSYGNPVYPGGGDNSSKSAFPAEGAARDAFLNWSTALVSRYGPLGVTEWELWK